MDFFGLLGEKLGHSLSPEIHRIILENIDKAGAYKLFEIERDKLGEFVSAVRMFKVKGFNITIPYKQEIMSYLDFISEEAERIGAVNSVVLKEDKLCGYNTDYYGFGSTFESKNISFCDKTAVILGAGGACKAAAAYILDNKVRKLYIVSRNPESVRLNIDDDRVEVINYDELEAVSGDVLINSTPVGMYPNMDSSPVSESVIDKYEILMDLIYNPLETKFLEEGRKKGKVTLDGLYMLVAQAVKAQEIFQDMDIDSDIIDSIYESFKDRFR